MLEFHESFHSTNVSTVLYQVTADDHDGQEGRAATVAFLAGGRRPSAKASAITAYLPHPRSQPDLQCIYFSTFSHLTMVVFSHM